MLTLLSCSKNSPDIIDEKQSEETQSRAAAAQNDSAGGSGMSATIDDWINNPIDEMYADEIPKEEMEKDTIPNDSVPNDSIPRDSIPKK